MIKFNIFVIRAVLGAGFAVILMRMFYPDANYAYVGLLAVVLTSGSYLREFFRRRNQ